LKWYTCQEFYERFFLDHWSFLWQKGVLCSETLNCYQLTSR